MKIALDVSPLESGHKVRGVGFYLKNLKKALEKYYQHHEYTFFIRGEKLSNVDIVHFPYFEPFFMALPLYKKFKTVVTVHDLTPIVFPDKFPRGIKGELIWQMQRFSLSKTARIVTDSESSKKDIHKIIRYPESKIDVVYLAPGEEFKKLNHGSWVNDVKEKYNLPEKFVLYVGDVTWNKNLPRLIRATKKQGLPLVMVGKALVEEFDRSNKWNKDLMEVQHLTEGQEKILKLGFVPSGDLVAIYNLATLFCMPSTYEGFGLPVLEAMACGCPVLTSCSASLPEVAGEAALFVNPEDQDDMEEKIVKLFENEKLRDQLTIKGLKRAQEFSWKKTASETLNAYARVLK